MSSLLPATYQELLEKASEYADIPKPDISRILKDFGFHTLKYQAEAPVFYVVDYTEKKYLYIDPSCKNMIGFEQREIINGGPFFYTSLWHPEDFKLYSLRIVPEILSFLKKLKPDECANYSFSHNYRIKDKKNDYVCLLQRSTIYVADDGTPLAAFGFAIDISQFKTDTSIIFTIEKVCRNFSSLSKEPIYKAVYYPEKVSDGLSKRELEVLQLIHEGCKSKEIADKLCLSKYTVDNHRKNLLQKTNSRNATELLHFSRKKGII